MLRGCARVNVASRRNDVTLATAATDALKASCKVGLLKKAAGVMLPVSAALARTVALALVGFLVGVAVGGRVGALVGVVPVDCVPAPLIAMPGWVK